MTTQQTVTEQLLTAQNNVSAVEAMIAIANLQRDGVTEESLQFVAKSANLSPRNRAKVLDYHVSYAVIVGNYCTYTYFFQDVHSLITHLKITGVWLGANVQELFKHGHCGKVTLGQTTVRNMPSVSQQYYNGN